MSTRPLGRQALSCALPCLAVALLLQTSAADAQVTVDWVAPERGVSVAVDQTDNVYTLDYDSNLGMEMVVTKRDPNGNLLWHASYDQTDATKWERASWITTDTNDDVIACGTSMSGYSNPVTAASVIMKLDPSGNVLWRSVYESSFDGSSTKKCITDASDNVYVLGLGMGPAGLVTTVKKFAPDGTPLWSYFDAAGIGAPLNMKLTPDDHLLLVGRSVYGSINGYAKVDLAGNEVWSYPGVYSLTAGDAAGDYLGDTYLVHGEYVVSGAGTVLKKVDTAGALLWEQTYANSGLRVEVGFDNFPVVSGYPAAGFGAAFFKVDDTGTLLWSNPDADGPLNLLLHAQMFLDADDAAYLAAGTLFEMAVCKVDADGTSAWTQTTTGSYANAFTLGHDGTSVYVVGGATARLGQDGAPPAPPLAPSGLVATPVLGNQVNLVWFDNASDETAFVVERCTGTAAACAANPGGFASIGSAGVNTTTFSDLGVAPGVTYSFRVAAQNAAGNSAYSNLAEATTPAVPAAPANLKAVVQTGMVGGVLKARVRLGWLDKSTNETSFVVQRCTGTACTTFAPLVYPVANATTYVDATTALASTYRYRIAARGPGGTSAFSNVASVTTP